MWTFEDFFESAHKILSMKVVDIFSIPTSQLLKIYVEPRGTLAEFQEAIAKQTGILASAQNIYWDNAQFQPDVSVKCESFPKTSRDNPMSLLDKRILEFPKPMVAAQRKFVYQA